VEFYLHEDDWGMRDLVPEENRFRAAAGTEEARAFGEAHRAPDGVGWTDMFVTPDLPISYSQREVTLTALRALLPELTLCQRFFTGYSTYREELKRSFAMVGEAGAIYGSLDGARVTRLMLADCDEAIAPLLVRLGRAHRLVLVDWYRDEVINLSDERAVTAWLE
jgi:hypothetical protein